MLCKPVSTLRSDQEGIQLTRSVGHTLFHPNQVNKRNSVASGLHFYRNSFSGNLMSLSRLTSLLWRGSGVE